MSSANRLFSVHEVGFPLPEAVNDSNYLAKFRNLCMVISGLPQNVLDSIRL